MCEQRAARAAAVAAGTVDAVAALTMAAADCGAPTELVSDGGGGGKTNNRGGGKGGKKKKNKSRTSTNGESGKLILSPYVGSTTDKNRTTRSQ